MTSKRYSLITVVIMNHKWVFIIIFEEGEYYREKINRVVDSFYWNKVDIRWNSLQKN